VLIIARRTPLQRVGHGLGHALVVRLDLDVDARERKLLEHLRVRA
jgi:hypothetical protein